MEDTTQQIFEIITSDRYMGWILLGIVLLVIAIFCLIVLYYSNKKKKAKQQTIDYKKNEIGNLSDDEIKNIANNVADPQTLYKKLEEHEAEVNAIENATANETTVSADENKPQAEVVANVEATAIEQEVEVRQVETPAATTAATTAKRVKKQTTNAKPSTTKPTTATTSKPSTASSSKPTAKRVKNNDTATVATPTVSPTSKPNTAKKPTNAKPTATQTKKDDANVTQTAKKQSYSGKWKITTGGENYYAELFASNGVSVLKTKPYKSLVGVKNGIDTIKKNVSEGNFATSVDKSGKYCFKLFSKSNRLICVSEFYSSKAKCEGGINSVKRFAETASVIIEEN